MDRRSRFFLCRPRPCLLDGSQAANLFVHGDEFGAESLKASELLHLVLCLAQRGGGAQRFRRRLALHFCGQAEAGPLARVAGLGAVVVGLATAPPNPQNRSRTEIAQLRDLVYHLPTIFLQSGE